MHTFRTNQATLFPRMSSPFFLFCFFGVPWFFPRTRQKIYIYIDIYSCWGPSFPAKLFERCAFRGFDENSHAGTLQFDGCWALKQPGGCGSKTGIPKWTLVSGNMETKTCGLPLLVNFEFHTQVLRPQSRLWGVQWRVWVYQNCAQAQLGAREVVDPIVFFLPTAESFGVSAQIGSEGAGPP